MSNEQKIMESLPYEYVKTLESMKRILQRTYYQIDRLSKKYSKNAESSKFSQPVSYEDIVDIMQYQSMIYSHMMKMQEEIAQTTVKIIAKKTLKEKFM